MNAIILAGRDKQNDFAIRHGVASKALVPINNQPMLDYVLKALLGAQAIESIVIVGPLSLRSVYDSPQVTVMEDCGDMRENALVAMRSFPQDQRVAVVTSDIPMITSAVVDAYLATLAGKAGDFFYPIIPKEVNESFYPGVKRTYATLGGRNYTGGNLLVINPVVAAQVASKLAPFVAERKNIMALSTLIGYSFLAKLLLGQLTVAEVEGRMSQVLGCHCVAVECPFAEIGTDVDKDSDLALARRVLRGS